METMLLRPHSRPRQRRNAAHAKFKQDDGPLMPASLCWAQAFRTQRRVQRRQQQPLGRIPKPLRYLAASARTTKNRTSRCKIWHMQTETTGQSYWTALRLAASARTTKNRTSRCKIWHMLLALPTRPAQTLGAHAATC